MLIGAWLLALFEVAPLALLPLVIVGLLAGALATSLVFSVPQLAVPAIGASVLLFWVSRRWFGGRAAGTLFFLGWAPSLFGRRRD